MSSMGTPRPPNFTSSDCGIHPLLTYPPVRSHPQLALSDSFLETSPDLQKSRLPAGSRSNAGPRSASGSRKRPRGAGTSMLPPLRQDTPYSRTFSASSPTTSLCVARTGPSYLYSVDAQHYRSAEMSPTPGLHTMQSVHSSSYCATPLSVLAAPQYDLTGPTLGSIGQSHLSSYTSPSSTTTSLSTAATAPASSAALDRSTRSHPGYPLRTCRSSADLAGACISRSSTPSHESGAKSVTMFTGSSQSGYGGPPLGGRYGTVSHSNMQGLISPPDVERSFLGEWGDAFR